MALPGMTRWLSLASMLALASLGAPGCATEADDYAVSGEDGSSKDDITQVDHTKVKRQSIGNCWLYATASWYEALNKAATGEETDTSESWHTYWHWFEQIANGAYGRTEISTGGSYGTAVGLVERYGLMMEGDFIPSEADAEMSRRQDQALNRINASLKDGVLSDPAARRDRATVREELDKAWALSDEMIERIDAVFGPSVSRTLDRSAYARDAALDNDIIPARDYAARLKDPTTGEFFVGSLEDAIGKSNGWYSPRQGRYAYNEVNYPRSPDARREFWKRVQRALHDGQPIISSWKVDFNALNRESRFSMAELERLGPGRQGGHMTVMHDYQAEVPGLGLLKAGELATDEEMQAALSDDTVIEFIRVKNSWGGLRPDRWDSSILPGYHDLELAYLNGPIKECATGADGETDTSNCTRDVTPLWDAVLPAGY